MASDVTLPSGPLKRARAAAARRAEPAAIAIMLTRRCNIACGHCSVVSGPDVRDEPSEAALLERVRAAAAAGVRALQLTGGEPMLRERVLLDMIREARRLGLVTTVTTNGFWGATPREARERLDMLAKAGLGQLTVSHDRWHEAELGRDAVLNVARAAHERAFPVQVNLVRGADDSEIGPLTRGLADLASVRLRFYDAQPVGRARAFPGVSLRSAVDGFCRAAAAPAITDDGRLTACNGPSYFAKASSPLNLGSIAPAGAEKGATLAQLAARHRDDPVLRAIRCFGPSGLRAELEAMPGFEQFPWRDRYAGMCDLCLHVTSSPEAVEALRERFAAPALAARMVAAERVIEDGRDDGVLSLRHANGAGAARVFFPAARDAASRLPSGADRVLGRPDLDWRRRADYLTTCGLARPLARILDDPQLTRWAPTFFLEMLTRSARGGAILDIRKREVLERIDQVLASLGARGVLLKGTAFAATTPADEQFRLRATGDVDVVVQRGAASELRRLLIDAGFEGSVSDPRSAPHHLAPVRSAGVEIEIHERIMPRFWGLPEEQLLARAVPVEGRKALAVLDAEGQLFHALVHCTAHLFAFGLKTAWDVAWIQDRKPSLDWQRIAGWARASALPRAFWTPLTAFAGGLALPIPGEILSQAPSDRRQRVLDRIASERIFTAMEGPFELNPFSKTAVFLLLADSPSARLAYLREIAGGEAAEARHRAQREVPSQALAELPRQLREAAAHGRALLRSLRRPLVRS